MAAGCSISRKASDWMMDRAQETADAGKLSRRAIELGKDDPIALCRSGITLAYVAGEVEEGAALIVRALFLDPNYAPAWGFSNWARNWLGQMDLAIELLAHAVRLSPLDSLIHNVFPATALAHFLAHLPPVAPWLGGWKRRIKPSTVFARSTANLEPPSSNHWPFRRRQDLDKYMEGVRTAGMPE